MTTTKHQRIARNGTLATVRLDTDNRSRLAYLERVANEFFGTKATASTVVRRALVELETTYERLRQDCARDPESAYLYKNIEARVLKTCNAPRRSYGVTPEQVRESAELKPPSEMARELALSMTLSVSDQLKADLKRWGVADE